MRQGCPALVLMFAVGAVSGIGLGARQAQAVLGTRGIAVIQVEGRSFLAISTATGCSTHTRTGGFRSNDASRTWPLA